MASTADSELDRIAEQAVADLRQLSALWREQGSAALDAALRGDPAWVFAVFDGRAASEGSVRLFAQRRSAAESDDQLGAVIFCFAVSATGERLLVAGWGDAYVRLSDGRLDRVAAAPAGDRRAEELAWRLDIGLDDPISVRLPEGLWSGRGMPRALERANRMLDGRLSYVTGAYAIWDGLRAGGYESAVFWSIFSALQDIEHDARAIALGNLKVADSWPSREEQLATLEIWAAKEGRAECLALLEQFQGRAFAEAEPAAAHRDYDRS
jgi:hypothetical protein